MSGFVTSKSSGQKRQTPFKRFLKDTSGVSAMMFAATLPVMFLIGGVAIDAAVITREQPIFYQTVDSAALAVAANELSIIPDSFTPAQKEARKAQMITYAKKFFKANYHGVVDDMTKMDLKLELTGQEVKLSAKLDIPTTMTSIFGIEKTTLRSNSTVKRAMRPIEIAFVLDTTGSMVNDMTALKTAANKMLATLYSDVGASKNMTSPFIRVGLVPFAATVRLNPAGHDFNMSWFDTTGVNPLSKINFTTGSGWHNFMAWGKMKSSTTNLPLQWNGCVEARTAQSSDGTNYITSDIAPNISNPESLFPVFFNPDSPSWYTSETAGWFNSSGNSQTSNVYWNNSYINAYKNYSKSGTLDTSLTTGSRKTGYDDSAIGNMNTVFNDRWKNVAKYDGKAIPPETFTLSGGNWIQNDGPWNNCTNSAVVPLTHQRASIETGITAMQASGNTNIAEGLAWGMRVLSPGAPFTQVQGATGIPSEAISPYNGPRWQKIVLLMSDGENNAGSGYTDTGTLYNAFGASSTPTTGNLNRYKTTNVNNVPSVVDGYTSTMCTQLKNSGVTIYAIGFRLDNPVLQNCASPGKYKFATTTSELVAYFDGIGKDVVNKMVYVAQ